jgi:hypothetical protein
MGKIFGVSRQTVYNWMGETGMDSENLAKAKDLEKAAIVFQDARINPNSRMINRPIMNGKSFVQLVRGIPCAEAMARRLVETLLREDRQRAEFAQRFSGRPRPDFSDVGIPSFKEDAQ